MRQYCHGNTTTNQATTRRAETSSRDDLSNQPRPHVRTFQSAIGVQSEAEQPDHPASLGDSNAASHSDQVFGTHSS
jgi:hypothetical protein